MSGKLIPLALLAATLALTGCSLEDRGHNGNDNVKIETPFGGMKVKTNDAVVALDPGLPVYPGATAVKDDKNAGLTDVEMNFGDFHLRVKAVAYRTADSPEKVIAFYRKGLARYGEVIECKDGRPVGTPSRTSEGLTCDKGKEKHITVSNLPMQPEVELKAGGKVHQHVVAIDSETHGTRFGLIALDLPQGDAEGRESN